VTATLSDDVLTAAQSGDQEALGRIYAGLSPAVLGYLAAKGTEDPEGMVQEVFLTVFTTLDRVTGGVQGLRTFAFSIAHARMVDEFRRRSRSPQMSGYDPATDARVSHSAETVVMESLGGGGVAQLLEHLNSDQREVLTLRIVADLSIEQVARIMGKSTGSIKQLQRRGLAKLKALVEERTYQHD
jgi:RNA polymerase sigma factor (sigma-70 family)